MNPAAPIPLVDLGLQHDLVADEVAEGWARLVRSGAFIDGPDVGAFEEELAAFSGAAHAIGCASGTDALVLSLRAAGIGPGDGVLLPANTFAATAEAVLAVGAHVQLADVDPATLLLDPDAAAAAVDASTRALIPVHLYGQVAPMQALGALAARHDLVLIADAAQAQGATQRGAGIAAGVSLAATSFYPGKNLGAYGDAGAVLTDDPDLARLVRSIGHHGVEADRYVHVRPGINSRLDTLQAVVLRAKLARLGGWNDERRAAADRYTALLGDAAERHELGGDLVLPTVAPDNEHVWHLYAIRLDQRDHALAALHEAGIGAGIHYPVPLHRQPAFGGLGEPGAFPVSEDAGRRLLSLPIFPGITEAQQARVVSTLVSSLVGTVAPPSTLVGAHG